MAKSEHPNSYLGRFWLPSEGEASAIAGIMDIGQEGALVRLEGGISPTGLLSDEVVFARLQGTPGTATLFNCFASAMKRGDGQVVSSKITSTLVALGTLTEDLGGFALEFQLPGSPTWFHERTFDVETGDDGAVAVRFQAYETTTYPLTPTLSLERFFVTTMPMIGWGQEQFHVQRPMGFRITSTTRLNFDQCWELMMRLRRFFEFVSQQHMPPLDLRLHDSAQASTRRPDIQIQHSTVFAVSPRKFEWDQQLLKFHEVEDRLSALLAKWFEIHEAYPEPFGRYFAAFDRDHNDAILHFLWNMAAVEELHKIRIGRKAKKDLIARLEELRSRWTAAFNPLPSDEVLEQIKDTRHYYAHAAGDLREKAVKDWGLLRYGDFLAAVANLEMLSLLGLTDQEAVQYSRSYWMSETLGLRRYPD